MVKIVNFKFDTMLVAIKHTNTFSLIAAKITRATNTRLELINRNFHTINTSEKKLQLTLIKLQSVLSAEQTIQTNTTKNLIAIQILSHFNSLRTIYLGKVQSLLNSVKPPAPLTFIENVVTNSNYCVDFSCYIN